MRVTCGFAFAAHEWLVSGWVKYPLSKKTPLVCEQHVGGCKKGIAICCRVPPSERPDEVQKVPFPFSDWTRWCTSPAGGRVHLDKFGIT
ncbi:hypothetical protein TNCV_2442251 [Trichonephila clavipes]|nr:hypothetical protein TNCV_2442251 [Trichonephila clavipes]